LKPKLRTYCKLKTTLRREPYLEVYNRKGLPELAKLRGGTNRLRIEKGRYRKEEVSERLCVFCDRQEVEDEKHFLLKCTLYNEEREQLKRSYEEITQTKLENLESEDEQLRALIGDTHQPKEEEDKNSIRTKTYNNIISHVMDFILTAMRKRRRRESVEGAMSS